eukprot:2138306-Pleurochrysis_carterae.AAC.2
MVENPTLDEQTSHASTVMAISCADARDWTRQDTNGARLCVFRSAHLCSCANARYGRALCLPEGLCRFAESQSLVQFRHVS